MTNEINHTHQKKHSTKKPHTIKKMQKNDGFLEMNYVFLCIHETGRYMFFETILPPELLQYDDGKRCLLMRRSSIKDAPLLVDAIQDSLTELHAFMPWSHFPQGITVDAQSKRLEDLAQKWNDKLDFAFHLFLPQDNGAHRFVGCLGIHPRCLQSQAFEIGYWIRSDVAGRGICTLATKMMIVAGFQVMNLERLQIGCDQANIGSRRVIEKVGFLYEGLQRNMGYGKAPPQIQKNGWQATGNIRSYALIPSDLTQLDWVKSISASPHFKSSIAPNRQQ